MSYSTVKAPCIAPELRTCWAVWPAHPGQD